MRTIIVTRTNKKNIYDTTLINTGILTKINIHISAYIYNTNTNTGMLKKKIKHCTNSNKIFIRNNKW